MDNTVRWLSYDFTVYTPTASWNDVAGVYIFTGVNNLNQWVALYVGQTDSFRNRIPSHEQWSPAVRRGATHIHAMVVPLAATRDIVEGELIRAYHPPLNAQLR